VLLTSLQNIVISSLIVIVTCLYPKYKCRIIIIIIFFFIPLVVKIPGVKKKLKTDVSNMEWSEVGVVVQDKRL